MRKICDVHHPTVSVTHDGDFHHAVYNEKDCPYCKISDLESRLATAENENRVMREGLEATFNALNRQDFPSSHLITKAKVIIQDTLRQLEGE